MAFNIIITAIFKTFNLYYYYFNHYFIQLIDLIFIFDLNYRIFQF